MDAGGVRELTVPGGARAEAKTSARRVALVVPLLVLLGIAAHAASLGWGFFYDDFFHQAYLRLGEIGIHRAPWNLYDFGSGTDATFQAKSVYPWWTSPDFRVHFFRPVASLTIWLDYLIFGGWAPGYHLTSLAFYAAFLAAAFAMFRSLGAPPAAAAWALAFLALNDTHVLPVGWIANRNTLLGSLFLVLAIWAVHRHRERHSRGWLIAAVISFLLACGSKESGLVGWPLVGWYLLVFDRPAAPAESLWRGAIRVMRSGTFWLFGAAAGAYLALYVGTGQGSSSGLYVTPWHEPVAFALQVLARVPLTLASLLFHLSTDLVYLRPDLLASMLALGLPLLGLLGLLLWRRLGGNRLALFAAGWAVLAVLPLGAADLSDRHLMDASVGTALLLGLFLADIGPLRELIRERCYGWLTVALLIIAVGIGVSISAIHVRSTTFAAMAMGDRDAIAAAEIDRGVGEPRNVLVLTTPSALLALTMFPTWGVLHPDRVDRIAMLQMGRRAIQWRRETDDTAIVTFETSPLLSHRYERMFYTARAAPPPGSTFSTGEFTATVLESEPAGIRTARLRFKKSMDDSTYQFLAWESGKFRRVTPPGVGQTRSIAAPVPLVPVAP
jgi:hypothetical protein